jgi:signal transduction histidine kinase
MAAPETGIARARVFDARRVDVLLAVVLATGAIAAVALHLPAGTPLRVAAVAAAAVAAATVAARRRAPAASVAVAIGAIALLARTDAAADETLPGLAALLGFYLLGRTAQRRRRVLVDGALLAGGMATVALSPRQPTVIDLAVTWALFVGIPFAAGRTIESRTRRTRELTANAERLRREQESRARRAAAEERTRIARELHDVIAHSLSVMVIQTAAAGRVAASDPAAARRALASVQTSGRSALLELRQMIGVLRHGDVELAATAAPGLGQLDLLAQRARLAGLPVELQVLGPRRSLPDDLDLVAFRIVQEALTNTLKHARPAHAQVTVTFAPTALELEICDDGDTDGEAPNPDASGGGHGLVGMRERVTLYGGQLSAGRRPSGGFRVHARIPTDPTVTA